MFDEDDLIPISALQHFIFCPRQCALIHLEQKWTENALTAKGRVLHQHVHTGGTESRADTITTRSLRVRSLKLGLIGEADIVEFTRDDSHGVRLPGRAGLWRPSVVEYKRGRPKLDKSDEVQMCAQSLCIEEMLNCHIEMGQLYYGEPKRRLDVPLGEDLRSLTRQTVHSVREILNSTKLPPGRNDAKCDSCSLVDDCLPNIRTKDKAATKYLSNILNDAE